ncbi:hypothetical protein ES319_D08G068300v1 [Gossypium barbadense]|nr:hypothetical protein ES319_D08G068300v1 [Gossypium barbadense]
MEHPKDLCPGTSAIVFLLLTGLLYLCVWSPSNPLLPFHEPNGSPKNYTGVEFLVKDELDLALEEASMPNKTVIIAVVNRAYVEQSVNAETTMLDLFLESFWVGEDTRALLEHLLLVTVDQTAYDRCMFKRLHCYRLVTEGVDFGEEKVYMSRDFVKMMWRRTLFLLDVLRRGYSFIFTKQNWGRNEISEIEREKTKEETERRNLSVETKASEDTIKAASSVFKRSESAFAHLLKEGELKIVRCNSTINW